MAQQSAEESLAADGTGLQRGCCHTVLRRTCGRSGYRLVAESLVWAMFVEEAYIVLADVVEIPKTEAQEVIVALAFDHADPGLRERVRIWRQPRCSQATNVGIVEQATELGRELAVAVVDEEPCLNLLLLKPHHQVSSLLLNPAIVGAIRGPAEQNLARADMDEGKTVGNSRSERRDHALAEEVTCDKCVYVDPDELLPSGLSCLSSAQGRGYQPFSFQDPPDGGSSELESQLP